MRTRARRRLPRWAAWVLAVVLGVPALAEAQLFPNQQIKRQRTPCCNENPIYGLYRRQYYGYYPTCWRRFPPGWGCPSSEAPNSASAIEEMRQQIEKEATQTPEQPEPGAESPFESNPNPEAPAPERVVPLPDDTLSPLTTPPATPPGDAPQAMLGPLSSEDGPTPINVPARGTSAGARRIPMASPSLPPMDLPEAMPELPIPTTGEESSFLPSRAASAPRRNLIGGMFDNIRGRRRR